MEFRIQRLDADDEMDERTEEGWWFGGRARRKKKDHSSSCDDYDGGDERWSCSACSKHTNVRGCSFSWAMAPWRLVAAHCTSLIFCEMIKQAISLASQSVPHKPIELGLILSEGLLRPMDPCILHSSYRARVYISSLKTQKWNRLEWHFILFFFQRTGGMLVVETRRAGQPSEFNNRAKCLVLAKLYNE